MNYSILFVILPLFSAFLAPLGGLVTGRFGKYLNLLIYGAGLVIGIVLFPSVIANPIPIVIGGWPPPFGINLYMSPLSIGAGILIYLLAFLIHISDLDEERPSHYHTLFSLFIFSSVGMIITGDLFNLFIFIEIGTIAVMALSSSVSMRAGTRGGIKYLVSAGFVSMIMLMGIGLIYSATGSLNMAHIAGIETLNRAAAFLIGVALLVALFFETELFPFNSWVPDVYKGSPSSFSAGLAGIGTMAGALVLGRIFLTMMGQNSSFKYTHANLAVLLWAVSLGSIFLGELAALREGDIKKVLAFSSIGQMGIITLAFAVGGEGAVFAGIFLLLNHSIAKTLLLSIAGFFIRYSGRSKWEEMRGIGRKYPFYGVLFIIGSLSLMGMPFFAGFWGKLELLKDLFTGSALSKVGAVVVLFSVIIEGIYFLRIGHSFFEKSDIDWTEAAPQQPVVLNYFLTSLPVLILTLIIIVLGTFPQLFTEYLEYIRNDLMDSIGYVNNILLSF